MTSELIVTVFMVITFMSIFIRDLCFIFLEWCVNNVCDAFWTFDMFLAAFTDLFRMTERIIFMAALHSRCGHYIFSVVSSFYLLMFFPRIFSAIADWMSTILAHMMWLCENLGCRSETCCMRLTENTGCKKNRQKLDICAPSHNFVGLYLHN